MCLLARSIALFLIVFNIALVFRYVLLVCVFGAVFCVCFCKGDFEGHSDIKLDMSTMFTTFIFFKQLYKLYVLYWNSMFNVKNL